MVLLALIRCGPEAAASQVHALLEASSGRELAVSTVVTTLRRMESKAFVVSWSRPAIGPWWKVDRRVQPANGAKRRGTRRFWSVAALGRRAVRRTLAVIDGLRAGLPGMGLERRGFRWRQTWRGWRWLPDTLRAGLRRLRGAARELRRAARRRRRELLSLLRTSGFDCDRRGRLYRVREVRNEDAEAALRERWGIRIEPRPPGWRPPSWWRP